MPLTLHPALSRLTWIFVLLTPVLTEAQEPGSPSIRGTDFTIPSSPAYTLLDANSALTPQPGVIRDFKVDWSLRSYRLAPNLALEAQPVWLLWYERANMDKYREATPLMKTLSTLSVSAGTLDVSDTMRMMAYAGKLTLWRQEDPLSKADLFADIEAEYQQSVLPINRAMDSLKLELRTAKDPVRRDSLRSALLDAEVQKAAALQSHRERVQQRKSEYLATHWNRSYIDVAFGRSYSFNRNFERIDSSFLGLRRNSWALWVNGSLGIGRHVLLTGLYRLEQQTVNTPDSLKTVVTSTNPDNPFTSSSVITEFGTTSRFTHTLGLNLRYGSPRFNFFVETIFKQIVEKPQYTGWRVVSTQELPDELQTISLRINESKLPTNHEWILAYGGEFKLSGQVQLNFAVRTVFNRDFRFKNLIPIASIACLMR